LDISATRTLDPDGEDTAGYDPTFREPIVYDTGGIRTTSRQELPAVRIPCQVENATEERLRELGVGDDPVSNMLFVFHRLDLETLGLLDSNREVVIKKGDRISQLERYGSPVGTVIKKFAEPGLFVWEVRGRSWGFGPDGYDLELCIVEKRREGATT
jgi:hypothetical protein